MKIFSSILLTTVILVGSNHYYGGSTAPVIIAGGIIKAQNLETIKKYKRSQCPVCKGKGWYISGDKIKKVDCGYCEPESDDAPLVNRK